jgi:hypothetical protein
MAGPTSGTTTRRATTIITALRASLSGRILGCHKPPLQTTDRTTGLLTTYYRLTCLLILIRACRRYVNSSTVAPTTSSGAPGTSSPPKPKRKYGGYNPAIHGDYDPNADYAREAEEEEEEIDAAAAGLPTLATGDYSTTAQFNRFTGRFQRAELNPENHNDENKSKRQMTAFFDVDAAANSHDGRSLKAERRGKALSKKELKTFKDKRRDKKEEKRRAWLRD